MSPQGFVDEQIQNLQRRVKAIAENPRPEFLKANKLRYEIELENMLRVKEAWGQGRPFAVLRGIVALTRPLGFEYMGYIEWGDRVRDPQRYRNIAVGKLGFPEHTCDRTMTSLGLFLSGEVPVPRLLTTLRVPCDPERWSSQAAAEFGGVLYFELARLNSNDYENIHNAAEQFGELIEFAEKSVPGIKYDEDRLVELLQMDQQAYNYFYDSFELRKRVPCPLSAQDCFRLATVPSRYPNPQKALEYARMYHDELFERAEKGVGGVKEEKLRIAWMATGPYGKSTYDLLAKKGVSMVWFHYGTGAHSYGAIRSVYGDNTYGRKLTPLEELARVEHWTANAWGGDYELWTDSLVRICKELKVDAVVDFLQMGCVTTNSLKKISAERLKKEVGVPTLDLPGREQFATEEETIQMNQKLEEFLDLCIANKK
ncbi:MAG: 2-hydroxyacyl-CoA dehydratase [Chloroflexi bacterium]|nr:2-hydroxyacyl-CoA dehydratase [Chloroflexota bacterium]